MLIAAGSASGAGATYKFSRLKKKGSMKLIKGCEFLTASSRLAFGEKVFCNRILKSKLPASGAVIKKDCTLNMSY